MKRRLYALSHRDLKWWDALLHPIRTVREYHGLVEHLRKAQERSFEVMFFSNDTQVNRLARDGFFEQVDALGVGSVRTGRGVMPGRDFVTLEFLMARDADVRKAHSRLVDVARSLMGETLASGAVASVVVAERDS